MKKKILVTGGTGFIGSAIVKKLFKEGYAITVLDNSYRSSKHRLKSIIDDIHYIEGDIRDPAIVFEASQGVDSILHLAAINGTENFYNVPGEVLEVGVRGILNIIDACKLNNISELFVASSSEAYQTATKIPTDESVELSIPDVLNPRYSYGGSKIISELLALHCCKDFMEKVIVFRPHNVYGPDMSWEHVMPQFILRAKQGINNTPTGKIPFEIQGDGEQTRAFMHIDDFTDALLTVMLHGEHMNVYHIGNPEEIKIKHLAEKIITYFNREINLITSPPISGGTLRRCPDISKIQKLGFNPKININHGLPSIIDWYVANTKNTEVTSTT